MRIWTSAFVWGGFRVGGASHFPLLVKRIDLELGYSMEPLALAMETAFAKPADLTLVYPEKSAI